MFVAQCAVESAYFERLVEDLFYTTASELMLTWPEHFPDVASTVHYIGNPEALANLVYANRNGNGDVASGDGWNYRGRGLIQLTGRSNDSRFARAMGKPLDGVFLAWMEAEQGAGASACWFWTTNGLNALADARDVEGATRRINGGLGALNARDAAYQAVLGVFGSAGHLAGKSASTAPISPQNPASFAPGPVHVSTADADDLNAAELTSLNSTPEQPT